MSLDIRTRAGEQTICANNWCSHFGLRVDHDPVIQMCVCPVCGGYFDSPQSRARVAKQIRRMLDKKKKAAKKGR